MATRSEPIVWNGPEELAGMIVPLADIRPLRRNPRRGDVELIRRLLQRWGQYQPIVVRRETGEIVVGNHRFYAARDEGWTHIAVIMRSIASDSEAEALAVADNVASDKASWDIPLLAEVLTTEGMEVQATGYTEIEIGQVIANAEEIRIRGLDDEAAAKIREPGTPEPPKRPTTRPGDLIRLGDHRLLCGDATRPADLTRLLGGELAALTFTDPPYGVEYRDVSSVERDRRRLKQKGVRLVSRFEKITGDDLKPEELHTFLVAAFTNVADHAGPKAALYTFHAARTATIFEAALGDAGYDIRAQIVWVKTRAGFNMAHYKYRHEPAFYAFRRGKAPAWHGDRSQTTVWEVPSDHGSDYEHPTQKPVRLGANAITNSSKPGEIVLDPFAGSGSALLCAAQLGRRGYAVEESPAYCDVIVARYEELTGEKAKRPRRRKTTARKEKK